MAMSPSLVFKTRVLRASSSFSMRVLPHSAIFLKANGLRVLPEALPAEHDVVLPNDRAAITTLPAHGGSCTILPGMGVVEFGHRGRHSSRRMTVEVTKSRKEIPHIRCE